VAGCDATVRTAVALHMMHYNFVRIHQTLRTTPPWLLA